MKNVFHKGFRKWSIAWICSFINFMYLGVPRLSGMLYLAAITRYNVSRNQASLPFVLCYTVRNISGPFIGYLSRKVEIRTLIVSGCLISSIGVFGCFFAENITTVSILYGGVFGLGFGLSTILIPCVLNQHFDQYRNNANGIALGGECIAGFVLPPLFELFLNTYGTSGSFLILSGLILHGVPAALLLKPPQKSVLVKDQTPGKIFNSRHDSSASTKKITSEIDEISGFCNGLCDSECRLGTEITIVNKLCNREKHLADKFQESDRKAVVKPSETISLRRNRDCENSSIVLGNINCATTPNYVPVCDTSSLERASSVNYSQNCEQYGSILPSHGPNCDQSTERHNSNGYSVFPNDQALIPENKNFEGSYLRVFLDPTFILILFTQSSLIFIATTFTTIVVDFSKDVGVSDGHTVYVLMCFSISDMVGRFCLGWVTDGGYMTNVSFSSMCYGVLGMIFLGMVWLRGFTLIIAAVFIYGLFLGGLIVIGPGITSDHIETDKVNIALASRFFLFAPMSLTQSSMIGYFRDTLGSYNGIFYLLGIHSFTCTAFSLLIPFTTRCRERRKLKKLDVGL